MGNVSLKVLEKSLKFLFKKGLELWPKESVFVVCYRVFPRSVNLKTAGLSCSKGG